MDKKNNMNIIQRSQERREQNENIELKKQQRQRTSKSNELLINISSSTSSPKFSKLQFNSNLNDDKYHNTQTIFNYKSNHNNHNKYDIIPTSTQAKFYSSKLPSQFTSTFNSINHHNNNNKSNQYKNIDQQQQQLQQQMNALNEDKINERKRHSFILGLSSLQSSQDNAEQYSSNNYNNNNNKNNQSCRTNQYSDNPEKYRVSFLRDSNLNQEDVFGMNNNNNNPRNYAVTGTTSRSPLKRQFTLSELNKEDKKQSKKVFYSLKNAIKKDTRQKLQQLTINQQAFISNDIKQNFIPKMLKIDHSLQFKKNNTNNNHKQLNQMHQSNNIFSSSSSSKQQSHHHDSDSDHQQKLLLQMQRKNIENKNKNGSIQITNNNNNNNNNNNSNNNQTLSMIINSQEPSCTNIKDLTSHNSSQTNIMSNQQQQKNPSQHQQQLSQNNISSTFRKMAFIYQNDVHAQNNGIDQKLLMIIKILDSRSKIMKDLKSFNVDNTILQLLEIMKFSIEYDDIDLMMDVMLAIGDIYIMFGDLQSAINTFNSIRLLADFTQNHKVKIECYLHLSQISKKIKQYHHALRFIKKALQYIWEINDIDREIHVYEEIGLVFFHLYNLEKATQFHQRAINGGVEFMESNQRQQASKNLHYYLSNLENKISSIDKYILLKITLLPFQFIPLEENESIAVHIQNPYMKKNKMKLSLDIKGFKSDLNELYQIEQIFSSDEFFIEIQTPRNDSQLNRFANNEEDIIISNIEEKDQQDLNKKKNRFTTTITNTNSNAAHSLRSESTGQVNSLRINPGQKFIPPKHLMKKQEQNTTFYLNESLKKKSLEEKIKDRVEELKLWEKRDHLGKLMNNPFKKGGLAQINQIIQINHLGVNRNIDNFDHSQNVQVSKSNMFFNKIISAQYQKNMNINI